MFVLEETSGGSLGGERFRPRRLPLARNPGGVSAAPALGRPYAGRFLGRIEALGTWVGGSRSFRCDHVGGRPPSASVYPTLRQTWPRVGPEAAMCVRKISAQCVLQFTPSLAAGCVLHRPVSRVIHCSELSFFICGSGFLPLPCVRDRIETRSPPRKGERQEESSLVRGILPRDRRPLSAGAGLLRAARGKHRVGRT